MPRLPFWLKQDIPDKEVFNKLDLLSSCRINTVCQSARCPNLSSCFKENHLTFMILGDICTRRCLFCSVKKSNNQRLAFDQDEAKRISSIVKTLDLNYVVITSVTRDDLTDYGAEAFVKVIAVLRSVKKNIKIELLIPDFCGNALSLKKVVEAGPLVIGHNIETVERLHKILKPQSSYIVSLGVLSKIKHINPLIMVKSSILLGLGEKEGEVISTMRDLIKSGCDILTLGQYLSPSKDSYPVQEYINPAIFEKYRKISLGLGFKAVFCGPLVRSSFKAEDLYREVTHA